jgi:lysophospholipase L1-like esterase
MRISALLLACLVSFLAAGAGLAPGADLAAGAGPGPASHVRWEEEIAAFEARDRENPPPRGGILFIGSSSIRLWKTLEADFPRHKIIHRGFGGSQIENSTYFAERIVFPYEPSMIVMYAGGNDIHAGKSAQRVAADFRAFVEKVRARLPKVRIAYISIAPNPARWKHIDAVRTANRLIADYCASGEALQFIDVFAHMLGPDGLPLGHIFLEDQLHMNDAGYRIWTDVVSRYLPGPSAP